MPLSNSSIDDLIETYRFNDPILEEHFKPVGNRLWKNIRSYGESVNEYGATMSKHLKRTSAIGQQFLLMLGFSEKASWNFFYANLLHDLGKAHPCFSPEIWQTPHRPTPEEREEKRAHTQLGVELLDLALTKSPEEVQTHPHTQITKAIQLYHHERIDGEGYEGQDPNKLGKVIEAICIIDAFDGDMVHRPHQKAQRRPEEALERMKTGEKYQGAFDPEMLDQFIDFQLPDS